MRRKGQTGYSDVYDGRVYQEQFSSGFLSERSNISLMFNTDGIPVFKSSGYSFWPLYLVINELPYPMRCILIINVHVYCFYRIANENVIFAGLWYGSTKPDMTLFLKPLALSLKKLHNEGK